jgi:hypothetical protein
MKTETATIAILLLLTFPGLPSASGDDILIKGSRFWLNGGIGYSSAGFSYGFNYSHQIGLSIISARFMHSKEVFTSGLPIAGEVSDAGALYGIVAKEKNIFISAAAGISAVFSVRCVNTGQFNWGSPVYAAANSLGIGFPVEAQLFLTPLSFLGIGLYGFANLNAIQKFGGILFCVQIGMLRHDLGELF